MDDLIKALQIFRKYTDNQYPTACEHDVLYLNCDADLVSEEDKSELSKFGFIPSDEFGGFMSFKYGSC